MEAPAARLLLKAANAETAEHVGIRTLKILVMVNTRKTSHVKTAISPKPSTEGGGRAPAYVWFFHEHKWKQRYDPSAKQQARAQRAPDPGLKLQASSGRPQAASIKPQASKPQASASSVKPQAASSLILDPRNMDIGEVLEEQGPRVFAKIKVL